ncbi:hypothetical protein ACPW96_21630 [Micromonospora sp. DT81.3]|uniref:hypothetical protein n=1 Tax=Micromonospora sp. DT81.3 TaxID=3416523 RepID=UPI003CF56CDE
MLAISRGLYEASTGESDLLLPRFADWLLEVIPTILLTLVAVLGGVLVLLGLFKVLFTRDRGGSPLVVVGICALVFGIALPWTSDLWAEPEDTSSSPTQTPSGSPLPSTRPVDQEAEAVDLTWLWFVLGSLAVTILLGVVIVLLVWLARPSGRLGRARERRVAEQGQRSRLEAKWLEIRELHNELLRKILHAETDWDSLFTLPALTDPAVPATYKMLRAMQDANTLRDTDGDLPWGTGQLPTHADLTALPYPRAVQAFALAWEAAERHARRVGPRSVPAAERKLIREIRTLLNLTENSATSATERNLAYRRAQGLIEQLHSIHIPSQALEQLEARQMPMLTTKREAGV